VTKAIRTLTEYKVWRMGIFQRDDFTCQICHIRGGVLQADHYPEPLCKSMERLNIKSKEDAIACSELWDIKTGRTLCKQCHKSTESYGRNRWQIINFTIKDIEPKSKTL
jgi:5-methylcytosine-specific restriction endonuclease McrA